MSASSCKRFLSYWKSYVFLFIPIIFCPLPIIFRYQYGEKIQCSCEPQCAIENTNTTVTEAPHPYVQMAKAGYILLVMAAYWITECVPITVTALTPMVSMPILGVLEADKISPLYWKDINMMFLGGLLVAVSVEKWNLHKRIALRILTLFGTKPRWLLLGFMLPSWFLSMWISNTATTAMMIPIVEAVLTQMKQHEDHLHKAKGIENNGYNSYGSLSDEHTKVYDAEEEIKNGEAAKISELEVEGAIDEPGPEERERRYELFCKCLSLSVAYAATTGGISTLTGTAPNLVMKEQADLAFEAAGAVDGSGLNFASWMSFGLPTSALMLVFVWMWLQIWFLGIKEMFRCKSTAREVIIHDFLKEEYKKLGHFTFAEIAVLIHFIVLALLWLTRAPGGADNGWATIMPEGFTTDSTPSILVALSLFFFPSRTPTWLCLRKPGDISVGPVRPLLTWEEAEKSIPFGVILLLGGGFALAEACTVSGLSSWIGEQLEVFGEMNEILMMVVLVTITAGLTEVTSNTAIAAILMPIFAQMAIGLGRNPLYLMFPTALACSFAFMLPVATPPNAVVFSYGRIKVIDMMKAGVALNVIGILVVTLATNTWGMALFDFRTLPAEFQQPGSNNSTNGTLGLCERFVNLKEYCK